MVAEARLRDNAAMAKSIYPGIIIPASRQGKVGTRIRVDHRRNGPTGIEGVPQLWVAVSLTNSVRVASLPVPSQLTQCRSYYTFGRLGAGWARETESKNRLVLLFLANSKDRHPTSFPEKGWAQYSTNRGGSLPRGLH